MANPKASAIGLAGYDGQHIDASVAGDVVMHTMDDSRGIVIGVGTANAASIRISSDAVSIHGRTDVSQLFINGKEVLTSIEDSYTSTSVVAAPTCNALRAVFNQTIHRDGGTITGPLTVSGTFAPSAIQGLVLGFASTSTTLPPTANAVKAVYDVLAASDATKLPLSGGTVSGSLAVAGQLAPSAILGLVQGFASTSTTLAPTANAVKAVYDVLAASDATKLPLSGGTVSGSLAVAGQLAPSAILGLVPDYASTSTTLPPTANALRAAFSTLNVSVTSLTNATLPLSGGTVSGSLAGAGQLAPSAILGLVPDYASTSTTLPPTANALRAAFSTLNASVTSLTNATLPLSGGTVSGSLAVAGQLAPSAILGLVQGFASTSTTLPPTANAVKAVYDSLTAAVQIANESVLSLAGGTVTGNLVVMSTLAPLAVSGLIDVYTSTSTTLPPTAKALTSAYNALAANASGIAAIAMAALPKAGGTLTGPVTLSSAAGGSNGLTLYGNSLAGAPAFYSLSRRHDLNVSQSFAGQLALARNVTSNITLPQMCLGRIAFGGNQTDGADSNVLFASSITGYAETAFSNASSMASFLTFNTGNVGLSLGTANAYMGVERMRITSTGSIGINTANPLYTLDVAGTVNATAINGLLQGFTSTSTTLPPTANAVKAVYDVLTSSVGEKLPLAGGTVSGSLAVAGPLAPSAILGLVPDYASTSTTLPATANALRAAFSTLNASVTSLANAVLPLSGGTMTGNICLSSKNVAPWSMYVGADGGLDFSSLANGAPQVQFTSDGYLWATHGVTTSSDERLKSITRTSVPAAECIAQVRQLNTIEYQFLDAMDAAPRCGFGAGNVRDAMPDAVHVGATGYLAVDHAVLLAKAIGAIQDIDERLRRLELARG